MAKNRYFIVVGKRSQGKSPSPKRPKDVSHEKSIFESPPTIFREKRPLDIWGEEVLPCDVSLTPKSIDLISQLIDNSLFARALYVFAGCNGI